MKYNIDDNDNLIIINDSGNLIFGIDKMSFNNYWYKCDYDQNDNKIYINSNYL